MPDWIAISQHIQKICGESLDVSSVKSMGGGCINSAYQLESDSRSFFIKTNSASGLAMFEAEFEGLKELLKSRSIRVPEPLCCGIAGNDAYLVMDSLVLGGSSGNLSSEKQLAEDLAAMHRVTQQKDGLPRYGWHRDNTIGSTPQINDYEADWATFWVKHRLGYQLALARGNGMSGSLLQRGERLCESLGDFFVDYTPEASLLHGDLWSGNYAFDQSGRPVIFDPAVYYGDREADLAMTELFGGFSADFYAAYEAVYPLDDGYSVRKRLYNLYHVLNHFNLFGGGYLSQAGGLIERLLSELH